MNIIRDMISGAQLGSMVGPAVARLIKTSVCRGGAVGVLTGAAAAVVISTAEAVIEHHMRSQKYNRRNW